jgi:hypothetical protein
MEGNSVFIFFYWLLFQFPLLVRGITLFVFVTMSLCDIMKNIYCFSQYQLLSNTSNVFGNVYFIVILLFFCYDLFRNPLQIELEIITRMRSI